MPLVHITLIEGRSEQQKVAMFQEVTDALVRTLNVPIENVRIALHEVPPGNFATAGRPKTGPSSR